LQKDKSRYSAASAAEKAKLKPALDELTARVAKMKSDVVTAEKEINRGFQEYYKVLEMKPQDRGVISEMASYYNTFRQYDKAAKTMGKLIDPTKDDYDAYMRVARAFYNGENYKSTDSVLNIVLKKSPNYLPAHLQVARTYYKMDPDYKMGLARQKFEKVIDIAQADSIKNASAIYEALGYLGYYHMSKDNYSRAKDYYNRMIALDPNNKEYKISGYNGLGRLESNMAQNEKTLEGKLAILARAGDAYEKILTIDPQNAYARRSLSWVQEYQASVKKGINPNEIKGVVRDAATGAVIPFASIRVKDTAAENLTNSKGEYKFEIPQGSEVLIISAKGYKSQEIPITKARTYSVSLLK
jgi:tetratricopeptide (TPR) repeat protein